MRPEPVPESADEIILEVLDARRSFGGLRAVDVQGLRVRRGTITAVIGPNGAGKTTLFNLLTGFDRADVGAWTFEGRRVAGLPAHRVARAGMVRTFQLTRALRRMSVLDNVRLAARSQTGERLLAAALPWTWRAQERDITGRADELLEQFGLTHLRDDHAGTLSGGQRKLLELARAMMLDPSMLLLDEPMAGVNPALTESLLEQVVRLRRQGTTVVFIEHDMDVVQRISDEVNVMAEGRLLASGSPSEISSDERVIEAYLGRRRDRRSV